jgi:hypothetical protein
VSGERLPTPAPDLRERILAAARAEASPTKAEARRRLARIVALGFALEIAIFLYAGAVYRGNRPDWLMASTTVGVTIIAAIATCLSYGRGRSMLGRPRVLLLAIVALVPLLLVGWTGAMDEGATPFQVGYGDAAATLSCFRLTLLLSIGPAVALLWARRATDPVHPRTSAAALGIAAGAWGTVAMSLLCTTENVTHVAFGHVLPAVVLAVLGSWIGARLLSLRAGPTKAA